MDAGKPETMRESTPTLPFRTLHWAGDIDGSLHILDQTRLPDQQLDRILETPDQVIEAICQLAVRGAPAIGVAAAYGLCLALRGVEESEVARNLWRQAVPAMRAARPTAVNLHHMVDRLDAVASKGFDSDLDARTIRVQLLEEAATIEKEDQNFCRDIGVSGAHLIGDGATILTHCNAGALATAGIGTALSVLYTAWQQGCRFRVLADETRPLLQGARLTAWELQQSGIPVDVIADGAAGHFFQRGEIDLVITGSDRVAANGDAANKIGTYPIASLARAHDVPFYIAAPSSTFDFTTDGGDQIPIEERGAEEIWQASCSQRPAAEIGYRNPAFDVTPASHIAGWITEAGVLKPPFLEIR